MNTPNDFAAQHLRPLPEGWESSEIDGVRVSYDPRIVSFDFRPNPDAHLGAEEKPYTPLVKFSHHGHNVHSHGKGSK